VLCTELGLQGLARLATTSKSMRSACHSLVSLWPATWLVSALDGHEEAQRLQAAACSSVGAAGSTCSSIHSRVLCLPLCLGSAQAWFLCRENTTSVISGPGGGGTMQQERCRCAGMHVA
jgi:hypothetical protein